MVCNKTLVQIDYGYAGTAYLYVFVAEIGHTGACAQVLTDGYAKSLKQKLSTRIWSKSTLSA